MKHYFALIGTSRNAAGGVRWTLTPYNSESDIIGFARDECARSGESLEALAGIGFTIRNEGTDDKEITAERDFAEGEEFTAALEKLNDDGRTYSVFDASAPDDVAEFLAEAERVGEGERARELVDQFAS